MRYVAVLLFLLRIGLCQATQNFGPYKCHWLKFESCEGPKKGDCANVRLDTHNMSDVIYISDAVQDCPVTKGKLTISKMQSNGKTVNKLWSIRMDSPCQHFVMGPILINSFNLTNRCQVNKGHYETHVNAVEVTKKFLGTSFFYGNYSVKITVFNEKNNIFCTYIEMALIKI